MKSVVKKEIKRFTGHSHKTLLDDVIVEEPFELFANTDKAPFLVTMRTPGQDTNLAIGLLFTLELISDMDEVASYTQETENQFRIFFKGPACITPKRLLTNSSCGLCNGSSWEEISTHSYFPIFDKSVRISSRVIAGGHLSLESEGDDFNFTGGNHKVALLDLDGRLMFSSEDVGRHNAFDKVLGQCLLKQLLPLKDCMVVLSGRCSFEMCQKAWQAGIPIIVSKGAPTSKAVELAEAAGITLVGFARSNSFNIYTHPYRIEHEEA